MKGPTSAIGQPRQGIVLGRTDCTAAVDTLAIEPLSEALYGFWRGLLPATKITLRLGSAITHVRAIDTRLIWPASTSLRTVSSAGLTTGKG